MSLSVPPPTLKIKRRRDEEPPEALYIQDAGNGQTSTGTDTPRSSKQRRLLDGCRVDYVFKLQPAGPPGTLAAKKAKPVIRGTNHPRMTAVPRVGLGPSKLSRENTIVERAADAATQSGATADKPVPSDSQPLNITAATPTSAPSSTLLVIQPPEPGDGIATVGESNATPKKVARLAQRSPGLQQRQVSSSSLSADALRPRRFHLSQQPDQSTSGSRPSSRVGKRSRVAVFVERELVRKIRSRPDLVGLGSATKDLAEVSSSATTGLAASAPDLRDDEPNTAASHPPGSELSKPINDWDLDSPALLAELEAWSLKEAAANEEMEKEEKIPNAAPSISTQQRTPLRYQPRRPPPSARRGVRSAAAKEQASKEQEMADSVQINDDTNDEDDYVYDTYIRVPVQTSPKMLSSMSVPTLASPMRSYGILSLTTTEMDAWEALYAEGEDSDSAGGNSGEDSDSNAEDWFGNDYPEEEEGANSSNEDYVNEVDADDMFADEFDGEGDSALSSQFSRMRMKQHTTADDEEWDVEAFDEADAGAWSGDEDADDDGVGRVPWKKHRS